MLASSLSIAICLLSQYVFLHGYGGAGEPEAESYTALVHRFVEKSPTEGTSAAAADDVTRGFARWDGTAVLVDGSRVSGHVYPLTNRQFEQVDRCFSDAVMRSAVLVQISIANGKSEADSETVACVMYRSTSSGRDAARARGEATRTRPAPAVAAPAVKQEGQEDKATIARGSWAAAAADGAALALKWGQSAPKPTSRG
eukprot:COSAG02_NODE_766_length_17389_cov_29.287045_8_plen_199_part_00